MKRLLNCLMIENLDNFRVNGVGPDKKCVIILF